MRVQYVTLGMLVVCTLFLSAVIYLGDDYLDWYELHSITAHSSNFDELASEFERIARERGGLHAFNLLRKADLPPNIDLHLLGHKVGDVMYTQTGIGGIAYCTQEFRNACSHTMVVGALTEFGEGALPAIRDACKKAPGGPGAYTMCYHGLGHGVFAFYEYSLPETVALCEKTGTQEYNLRESIECIGGAIMELTGGGGHDPEAWQRARDRYLKKDEPLSPCLSSDIPENARAQCLTYLTPELWKRAGINLGHPNPMLFKYAFKLCESAPQNRPDLRETCYASFGKEFIPLVADRDIRAVDHLPDDAYKTAQQWCSYAGNTEGERACIVEGLHSIFWGGENDPDASFRYCSLVDNAGIQDACYRDLAVNITHYIRDPNQHDTLCARLPENVRDRCNKI